MKSISNDFVTIEYKNRHQKKVAEYYIDTLNSNKEFYIGLLNGKTIIHSDELSNVVIDKKYDEDSRKYNSYIINECIMKLNGIEDLGYIFDEVNTQQIYNNILILSIDNVDEKLLKHTYFDLAYDYFNMTKDFTYLKKLIYDKNMTKEDVYRICDYKLTNCCDDLIREKIYHEVKYFNNFDPLKKDITGILKLIQKVAYNMEYRNKTMVEHMKKNNIYDINKEIPKIDYRQYEGLVIGTLRHIDPSLKLVEEYIKYTKEGRIHLFKYKPDKISSAYYNEDDYGINIYMKGNIEDVITLVHEFGHLHFRMLDRSKKEELGILAEYPAIYFELKAAEYLKKQGYTKEEIEYAKYFRTENNSMSFIYLAPTLISIHENMDKDKKDYDLSMIQDTIKNYNDRLDRIPEVCPHLSKEEQQSIIEKGRLDLLYVMFRPAKKIMTSLLYMLGTFFAEDAIDNLKNENVLKILEHIQLNKTELYNLIKMHRMSPEYWGFYKEDENPKIKEKIDDIDNQ